ncbi:neo-calmodulin-like [Mercenaria mercenaria]|uniref:neo-calmodulin-like n=1 Tax=Mercenaria mercenaria TaxID=6596 RepID=UPI00234E9598|nr:neo-calmodulin-like [Mercenaria mercenaria]
MSDTEDNTSPRGRRGRRSIKRKQEMIFHIDPSEVYPPTKQIHQLTDYEIQAYKEAFWKYDKDGSGTIDVKELNEMLKSMGREIPISDVLDIVAHFDQDESGAIDFPEFLILMANLKLGNEDEEYLEAFNIIDTENKGEIGHSELKAFLAKLECNISQEDLDSMIRMADTKGNGKLHFKEFADIMKEI